MELMQRSSKMRPVQLSVVVHWVEVRTLGMCGLMLFADFSTGLRAESYKQDPCREQSSPPEACRPSEASARQKQVSSRLRPLILPP